MYYSLTSIITNVTATAAQGCELLNIVIDVALLIENVLKSSTMRPTSRSSEMGLSFDDDVVIQPREILRRRYDGDDYRGYMHSPVYKSSSSTVCVIGWDRLGYRRTAINTGRLAFLSVVIAFIYELL